jgi:hypothetical protein
MHSISGKILPKISMLLTVQYSWGHSIIAQKIFPAVDKYNVGSLRTVLLLQVTNSDSKSALWEIDKHI